MHKCVAVKSPLGAQTVLGDRHDPVCDFFCKCRRPPAELARENFPTAGHASRSATETAADTATDTAADTATENARVSSRFVGCLSDYRACAVTQ